MSYQLTAKTVSFEKPFLIEIIGTELPPGDYQVTVEIQTNTMGGHSQTKATNILHIPEGALGPGSSRTQVRLLDNDLEEALAMDRG